MKYHAIVHIASDSIQFGVPLEIDTGSNEAGHKRTKAAAQTTQKNQKTFDIQTGTRVDEFHVIDMGMEELAGRKMWMYFENAEKTLPNPPEPPTTIRTHGTKINILEALVGGKPGYSFGEGPKANIPLTGDWDCDILLFLYTFQNRLKEWVKPTSKLCIRGEPW
jgi:hypothetical protein